MQPNLFIVRLFGLVFLLGVNSPVWAQWDDVSEDFLVEATTFGSWFGCGISSADFNLDGWDDVTTAGSDGFVKLFLGSPEGFQLEDSWQMPEEAKSVLWVDVDNDGDLDLFVGVLYFGIYLYIQGEDGTLSEQSDSRGITNLQSWDVRGFSARDYDRDGDLDIYVCSYHDNAQASGHENKLFNNDGHGFFEDVTLEAGVGNGLQHSFQSHWFDHDGDGYDDLWVINDRTVYPNALYRNLGNGSFQDISEDINCAIATEAMTATLFDPDNDGDWDQYVTNVENVPNFFLLNMDGSYQNIAAAAGVDNTRYGWGTCALDIDGDRWDDLMVATYRFPNTNPYDNVLYMNDGTGLAFIDETENWPNEQFQLYCLARLDLDGDRAPDLMGHGNASYCQALRNQNLEGASRMTVTLVGVESNIFAVGAVIYAHLDGLTQMRQVEAGCDYLTQHTYKRFFAFGDAEVVDSLEVFWPLGGRDVLYDVPADTAIVVIEGASDLALIPQATPCPWDNAEWLVPFNPDEVNMTWNGEPVTSEVVVADQAGTWTLTASWWNGIHTWSESVTWTPPPAPSWEVEVIAPTCHGDSALVSWNIPGEAVVSALDSIWPSVMQDVPFPVGEHSLLMQLASGCPLDTVLSVVQPPALFVEIEVVQPACFGDSGSFSWVIGGGTPPLSFDFGDIDAGMVGPGAWPLLLTDTAGCLRADTVVIVEPDLLHSSADWAFAGITDSAMVSLVIAGGTPPYEVIWSGEIDGDGWVLAPAGLGWFVQDAEGCLHLGVLDIPANPLAGLESTEEPDWGCRRTENGIAFQAPDDEVCSMYVLDLQGRLIARHGEVVGSFHFGLETPGMVVIVAISGNGEVRRWLR